jgi:hypothetical protein
LEFFHHHQLTVFSMKPAFIFAGRLGKKLPSLLVGCWLALPLAALAQQGTFISPSIVNSAIQVNATNFINTGVWNITSPILPALPYQTASTYNYTNSGTMNCTIGWEFDHGPFPTGPRGWSANFFNDNPGTISALDPSVTFIISQLLISATNIVNKGLLSAGPNGLLILHGSGVNLTRSGLEITALIGTGSDNVAGQTNFTPDTAVYDEYWRGGTNAFTFVGSPWTGTQINAANLNHVGEPCGVTNAGVVIGPLAPQAADSYTNTYGASLLITTNMDLQSFVTNIVYSNIVQQAIFVSVSDPNIFPSVRFGPSLGVSNIFLPMAAQLLTQSTNVVTGALQTSTIYVVDDLAAVGTNGTLLQNTVLFPGALCQNPTFRPDSVVVSRLEPFDYAAGQNFFGVPSGTFFYDPATFSNLVVNGRADTYSALVDNLVSQPPAGFSVTNVPGRVEVYADSLNLSKVRVSAAGEIIVQASNLVSSAGAAMDCQNLSYNLGSTNGSLNITNLAGQTVHRLNGTVNEWSGIWTNYMVNVYTNNWMTNSATTNGLPPVQVSLTNVTEMDLAITVVDAGGLTEVVPVTVLNLILHSTNIVVSDTMTVGSTLLFDGQSLTIQGGISVANTIQGWTSANAPTLRYFTNNGDLEIPNSANFGNDGPTNYAVFVNTGTISAGSETINSDIFQSGGSQSASAGFFVTTTSGKIENGSISSDQDVQFAASTLKFNNASITAGDQLYFYVTGSLFDAGGSSGNVLTCNNGFDLAVKPATGDLLGTALKTITPMFASVEHFWPGLDLGASNIGYTNNEAVGQLILDEGFDTQFVFNPTGARNAIYVDLLDLSKCPDFLDPEVLTINPNFVIYYAAVKLPSSFTVPPNTNGIAQEPEEYLNGQLGGHLVWVPSFAGPNSSVDVLINGQTVLVNTALRYSKIIDSNTNGIPNFYDPNPFDAPFVAQGALVQNNPPPAQKFAISWTAASGMVYQVQYSTNYFPAIWSPLLSYTNSAPTSVLVTVWDTNAPSGQRYYRVSHP